MRSNSNSSSRSNDDSSAVVASRALGLRSDPPPFPAEAMKAMKNGKKAMKTAKKWKAAMKVKKKKRLFLVALSVVLLRSRTRICLHDPLFYFSLLTYKYLNLSAHTPALPAFYPLFTSERRCIKKLQYPLKFFFSRLLYKQLTSSCCQLPQLRGCRLFLWYIYC